MKNAITLVTSGAVTTLITALPIPEPYKAAAVAIATFLGATYHLYQPAPKRGE